MERIRPIGPHSHAQKIAATSKATGETPALASHNEVTYFEGSNILLNPAKRPRALAQLRSRGVKALRVELYWRIREGLHGLAGRLRLPGTALIVERMPGRCYFVTQRFEQAAQ